MADVIDRKSVITSFESDTKDLEAGAERAKKLVNNVADVSKKAGEAVKTSAEETKKLTLESSKLGDQLKESLGPIGGIVIRITSAVLSGIQALRGAALAARAYGVALVATGVGAIVIAVTALAAAFFNTQRGADALSRVLLPLKAIFSTLLSIAEDLGTKMVDAFKNPKQALADIGNLIKENLINRLLAFREVAEGIINLDFKQIGNGFLQGFTGIQDVSDKVAALGSATSKLFDEAARKGRRIADLNIEISKLDAERNLRQEEINQKLLTQQTILNRTDLGVTQRKKAYDEILKLTEQQASIDIEILRRKQDIIAIEKDLNAQGRTQDKEINDLAAERLRLEGSLAERRKELAEKLAAINKEAARKAAQAEKDRIEAIKKSREQELKEFEQLATDQIYLLEQNLRRLGESLGKALVIDDRDAVISIQRAMAAIQAEITTLRANRGEENAILDLLGIRENNRAKIRDAVNDAANNIADEVDRRRAQDKTKEAKAAQERLENIDRIKQASIGALESLSALNQQQIDQVNQAISIQTERVSRYEELAKTGSARQLIIEEERLDKMETIRNEALAKQRRLAQAQMLINQAITVSESVKAIAQAFGTPGPLGIVAGVAMSAALALSIASMASNIGGLFSSIPAFAKGQEVIHGPGTGTSDSIMARLSKGERVTDASTNKKVNSVARGVFPNRLLPDAVRAYMSTPEITAAMQSMAVATEKGFKEMVEEQRNTRVALQRLKVSSTIRDGEFATMVSTYQQRESWRRQ